MRRLSIAIWSLFTGIFISIGVGMIDPNLFVLPMAFALVLGLLGMSLGIFYQLKTWQLNRRKNSLLPLSYRIKQNVKNITKIRVRVVEQPPRSKFGWGFVYFLMILWCGTWLLADTVIGGVWGLLVWIIITSVFVPTSIWRFRRRIKKQGYAKFSFGN
ncbi:MAG: hypothetical protein WBF38_06890 [Nitrosotalea sp.]